MRLRWIYNESSNAIGRVNMLPSTLGNFVRAQAHARPGSVALCSTDPQPQVTAAAAERDAVGGPREGSRRQDEPATADGSENETVPLFAQATIRSGREIVVEWYLARSLQIAQSACDLAR